MDDGNVLKCWSERLDAIYHAELGASAAILRAGYNLDCLLQRCGAPAALHARAAAGASWLQGADASLVRLVHGLLCMYNTFVTCSSCAELLKLYTVACAGTRGTTGETGGTGAVTTRRALWAANFTTAHCHYLTLSS